ncbi:MAG: hypothetical protein NZ928_02665 [Endomicrobia bacterium]|nr:hypothetical protein [Endomicrobiia bacterium]MDW8055752.1 hypothetical protein [Elusimicrobiota bacterium]
MNCKKIQHLISKFFDREQITQDDESSIFSHIKICKNCSSFFTILSKLYTAAEKSYDKVEFSKTSETKLYANLRLLSNQQPVAQNVLVTYFKKILVPILGVMFILVASLVVIRPCAKKIDLYTYELYPEEDIDITMFEFLLSNNYIETDTTILG